MLSKRDLERTIEELEKNPCSFQDCQKLATFYTLYDHIYGETPKVTVPVEQTKIGDYGDTDFLKSIVGMDAERAWVLMDELMSAVQITNKRLYDSVMRKIAE